MGMLIKCYVMLRYVLFVVTVPKRYLTNYSDFKFQSSYDADANQLIKTLS